MDLLFKLNQWIHVVLPSFFPPTLIAIVGPEETKNLAGQMSSPDSEPF